MDNSARIRVLEWDLRNIKDEKIKEMRLEELRRLKSAPLAKV